MKVNVVYEENFQLDVNQAFDITMQWLKSQYKAKIKVSTPPKYIEAKQGTMMTNTGHDPNWKKRIGITFYELNGERTLLRVEATPLARNIFRVEKLKESWFKGLFSHLFSLLQNVGEKNKPKVAFQSNFESKDKSKYCPNCGERIKEQIIICPACGITLI